VPTAAVETVRFTPGTTPVNVFVAEWIVSPPRVIAASRPAETAAPPSRSEPSALVRVKSAAAPV